RSGVAARRCLQGCCCHFSEFRSKRRNHRSPLAPSVYSRGAASPLPWNGESFLHNPTFEKKSDVRRRTSDLGFLQAVHRSTGLPVHLLVEQRTDRLLRMGEPNRL